MSRNEVLRWLKHQRVAVLKGGWSRERPISLKTGKAVEGALGRLGIQYVGIDVKPDIPHVLRRKKIKFCFNALHGPFGEDGRIQGLLDVMNIPYTGSGALPSAVAMDKHVSKELFRRGGVPTPPGFTVWEAEFKERPREVIARARGLLSSGPVFVKPVDQGSAIGVSRVAETGNMAGALRKCFALSKGALIEKLIVGRELTVGILGTQALPVTEIIAKHDFYDFYSKYSKGGSRHLTPAPISKKTACAIQELALRAFRSLGCSVYGRVDVMMRSHDRAYVLEVNTIPGMTPTSLLPDGAGAMGMGFDDLVFEIIFLSLKERLTQLK